MKIFVSYRFDDHEDFISQVCLFLEKQGLEVYYYKKASVDHNHPTWVKEIEAKIKEADCVIVFAGDAIGESQRDEMVSARAGSKPLILVELSEQAAPIKDTPSRVVPFRKYADRGELTETAAANCAREIAAPLTPAWIPFDEIPEGFPFSYEKEIIREYIEGKVTQEHLRQGCPARWPQITRTPPTVKNRVPDEKIGPPRDHLETDRDPQVLVAAVSQFPAEKQRDLAMTFPLAGPRRELLYDQELLNLKVGILVSGGIAPGINAVISGIVERHYLYAKEVREPPLVEVKGYYDGFKGFISVFPKDAVLTPESVADIADSAGSILGTSREPRLSGDDWEDKADAPIKKRDRVKDRQACLNRVVSKIRSDQLDVLYIIGGDGTMRAAHVLSTLLKPEDVVGSPREGRAPCSIMAIPKTMDNDVLWGWQTFGFVTAVERADELIHQLHTEAESNPRACVLQLFGSDSGYVVTHAALASGVCDLFLIPEVPFRMKRVAGEVIRKLQDRFAKPDRFDSAGHAGQRSHAMILMAETAIPLDAWAYLDDPAIGLNEHEKEAIRKFLKIEYWGDPALGLGEDEIEKIKKFLGLLPGDAVALTEREKSAIRDYHHALRTTGQTPDVLRTSGLKLVSGVLQKKIRAIPANKPYWERFRVFSSEPRHMIRAVAPRSSDILFAQRLGTLAVDCAMAGYTDVMISQWLTEYVMVPLRLVTLGRKRVPVDGIFYKSAIAKTGQPADLLFD